MSDFSNPELDDLVRRLNTARQSTAGPNTAEAHRAGGADADNQPEWLPPPAGMPPRPARAAQRHVAGDAPLAALLRGMLVREASDLHLIGSAVPRLRIDGELELLGDEVIEAATLQRLFEPHLGDRDREQLERRGAVDFSLRLDVDGGSPARFRVNLHRQRGEIAGAIRALPRRIPQLSELRLPESLRELVLQRQGLVLVCGPTGSGKTTTLAALVDDLNRNTSRHIVTIEDPVEYHHQHVRSLVEQVEVGVDSPTFAEALRAALRQDPDVILLGEMRDLESISTALTAAETGHLILGSVHTNDAAQAVHRIVDVFPEQGQMQVRQQLALALNAVVSQRLLPRLDGRGRVPAIELLHATYPVRQHIRSGKVEKLQNELALGQRYGMVTMEASLASLVTAGLIDVDEARARTAHPELLDRWLEGV